MRWHAFGPVVALTLLLWSARSLRRGDSAPPPLPRPLLVGGGVLLMVYWLLRLAASLLADLPASLGPGLEFLHFPAPGGS
jgi:hypothetical protein